MLETLVNLKESFIYLNSLRLSFFTNFFHQFQVFLKNNGATAKRPLFLSSSQSVCLEQF